MNVRYSSVNKSPTKDTSSNINRLNMSGQSIILGKNFNILKYLDEIEKIKTENEIKNKPGKKILPLMNFQTPQKRAKYFSIDTNNISSVRNGSSHKNDYNNDNDTDNDCFLTSLGKLGKDKNLTLEKNKISLKYNHSNRNRNRKLYENNRFINSDIHLSSIIKEIRNKTKNLYKNCKTENSPNFNNDIAYDNKNMEPIINLNNILNDYREGQEWNLKKRENRYNDFVNKNKEIKVQNVLKNLINNEKAKIDTHLKKYEKKLDNLKNTIDEDEKNFNQIIKEHKYYSRIIEDNLYKLKDQNKILIYLKENIVQQIYKVEYEIMKKIYEIDELSVYAKFVNYIYGNDITKFEKIIVEKDNKKQLDIDLLINNALGNYKSYLDNKNKNEIDNFDPDIIYNEMKLIEDRILLALKMKDKEYEDLKIYKNKNELILNGIINKEKQLEKEYNYLKEECNYIINYNSNQNNEKDLFEIAQELFMYVIENFTDNNNNYNYNYSFYFNDKKNDVIFNPFEIGGLAEKSNNLTLEKESLVNEYIQIIEKCEKEDPKIFSEIINIRKEQIILEKLKAAKERIQNSDILERMNIQKKSEKIYFIKRKMHQSLPKKKKHKIRIDPNIIRQKENIEIMTYE